MPILNRNNAVSPPPSRSVANSDAGAPVAPLPLPPCSYFGNHILHVTLKDDSGNWVIPDVISQCIAQIRFVLFCFFVVVIAIVFLSFCLGS